MSKGIQNVSDTAVWVATYRAEETLREDALFRDPLAKVLVGERGPQIAKKMLGGNIVGWSVLIRTRIIDRFIEDSIQNGIDTVLNLGAGLDTRPYRMNLPKDLRWVEVDFPEFIEEKNSVLKSEKPLCFLERVGLDLSRSDLRKEFFSKLASESKKVLVITEGVVLYLSKEDVAALSQDLQRFPCFRYWIVEYFDKSLMKRMLSGRINRKSLKNAPLRFDPGHFKKFFSSLGWHPKEIRYLMEEGEKLNRPAPMSWLFKVFRIFLTEKRKKRMSQLSGYILLESNH